MRDVTDDLASVEPHPYRSFSRLDWFRGKNGRCLHCLFPKAVHPIRYVWVGSRYVGQTTRAYPAQGSICEGYLATVAVHDAKETDA